MRRPRPHVQRGIRLAIAVFIACVIGYGVILPRGGRTTTMRFVHDPGASAKAVVAPGVHDHYAKQWIQSFKWCAITCVVSNLLTALPLALYTADKINVGSISKPDGNGAGVQVVSAPVIGKVAQVGIERVVGTVIGGWTGYAVYMLGSQVWNSTTDGGHSAG